MDDWGTSALQAAFWLFADNLRSDAKLCDIIIYVRGRHGDMVGYPAHKIVLISASKYFKLLFEREDLRNYCHFPHLNEEGVYVVLNIVYGRKIPEDTNIDDAIMAARFLQIDNAVEALEKLQLERESKKKEHAQTRQLNKRKINASQDSDSMSSSSMQHSGLGKTAKRDSSFYGGEFEQGSENESEGQSDSNLGSSVQIKQEPDVDLTEEDDLSYSEQYADEGYDGVSNQNYSSADPGSFQHMTYYDQQGAAHVQPNFHQGSLHGPGMSTNMKAMGNTGESNWYYQGREFDGYKNKQTFECDICGRVLGTKIGMTRHKMIHMGDKPFSCDVCGMKFLHKGNLNQHSITHRNKKDFSCPHCNQKFFKLPSFENHLMVCVQSPSMNQDN